MKLSMKLFLAVSLLIVITIVTVILLNTTVLESFYKNEKEKLLVDVYKQAVDYYRDNEITDTSEFFFTLQKIDSTKNIEIVVADLNENIFFSSSNNFLKNGFFLPGGSLDYSIQKNIRELSDEKTYSIRTISDKKMNSDYATLYGLLSSGYIIVLRTPIESIRESVTISNRFLIIIGFSCILVTSLITYIISKKFSKPILELSDIAENMSNLDFSKKYSVTTQDEIGTLGSSINKLSSSLEKTIQDLKEANMELEKDVEEKSKLSEMRNQFISDVSHELKTPIALIQGYAEGLNDGIVQDEESKKYYIEVILDEANKMSILTKDLLDLSRLEYGKEELQMQEFNLTELVQNTLKKNEVLFQEKNVNCIFDVTENYIVNADCTRIEQVLTNYISNALKHVCNENIIKCTIEDTINNKVRFTIFNSGKNISDEDLPRLWTRFYKADTSRNREVGGTGIGLSLVKAIMNQHHQHFGVQNVDGGVEFWFEVEKA